MSQNLRSNLIAHFHKFLFLAYLIALILPICAMLLAITTGYYNQFAWWIAPVLIVLMGVDQLLRNKWSNPSNKQLRDQEKNVYYVRLLSLCSPAAMVLSVCGAYFLSNPIELDWAGRIGWTVSLGLPISLLALCAGHELIHRGTLIERLIGGFLFAFVLNAAYKTEHIRGHHVNAATPADTGSASFNQSFYHFLPHAFKNIYINAWLVEKKRLNRKGHSTLCWRNEFISLHIVSMGIAVIYYIFFGLFGIIFFIAHGLIAILVHHVINYIQHYGLKRRKLDDGRYEKFSAAHAWSCDFLISNLISFNFPHHANHHLNPRHPYQYLRHLKESPQMPVGYFGMFFMALIPPLWFKAMNPLILAYNDEVNFRKPRKGNFKKKKADLSKPINNEKY